MDGPVTKKDLDEALAKFRQEFKQELKQELKQEFRQELKQELRHELNEFMERITELVRDAQTEILKAFFPFQESVNVRFRKLEVDSTNTNLALSERMNFLERRLQEIEKKLLMHPPTA